MNSESCKTAHSESVRQNVLKFTSWPSSSPHLNSVDYSLWTVQQQLVYWH